LLAGLLLLSSGTVSSKTNCLTQPGTLMRESSRLSRSSDVGEWSYIRAIKSDCCSMLTNDSDTEQQCPLENAETILLGRYCKGLHNAN
jgi:hypothetical protein